MRLPTITAALMLSTARFTPFDAGAFVSGQVGQSVTGEDLNTLDAPSADHVAMATYWQKVDDIVTGTDRMREQHDLYLPKFPNETATDYEFRWKHSKFTNVYRDVVENLASKPFEEEITLNQGDNDKNAQTAPTEIEEFCEDVDGAGSNLTVFAVDTFFNGINSAIDWIWIDYTKPPADAPPVRSIAVERELGMRPFWTHVLASNVLQVRSRIVKGKERITYVRIVENEPEGKYIRLMRADEFGASWELYREVTERNPNAFKYEFVEAGPITIGLIPMVPFVTGRRKGRSWQFHTPMGDAADLQLELYQQESGLKNVKAHAGFPILAGNGVNPETEGTGTNKRPKTLQVGPSTVLYGGASNDGSGKSGSWNFIGPDGAVLTFLQSDVDKTIQQLRELGRSPLTAQSGNLTVITTAVAAKKGNSAVKMWALGLKDAIENALVFTCMWMGIERTTYDPNVTVFTDFGVEATTEDLIALKDARASGDISGPQYRAELKRRGTLRPDFDEDQNNAELLLEVPAEDDIDPETGLPYVQPPAKDA